mmetsp:Transcript_2920/g.4406  ORF Transcript_2920/g.4406 Transcript_2920/m.4406 type:complete len:215 (-) Transcript_2920:213-857(-)
MSYISHKQRWFRVRADEQSYSGFGTANSDLYQEYVSMNRTKSMEAYCQKEGANPLRTDSKASTDNKSFSTGHLRSFIGFGNPAGILKRSNEASKPMIPLFKGKKKVQFNRLVKVVLIPGRKEIDTFTKETLWWTSKDLQRFRERAVQYWKLHGRDIDKMKPSISNKFIADTGNNRMPKVRPSPPHIRRQKKFPPAYGTSPWTAQIRSNLAAPYI